MSTPQPKLGILDIRPYVPGKSAAAGFAGPIKLSSNENALGCSEAARSAYRDAAAELHLYPDSQASALREAIAAKHAIEPDRILFGTGSDEIFNMVCQTYLEAGDNIVQPEYGFAAWAIAARGAGGFVKSAPERDFTVDMDAILAAIDARTRIVFIANPANPTGTYLTADEVARLHTRMPANVLLVLDGAYAEYARGCHSYADGIDLARAADNVIVTRTFSKLYGLAALRLGWAYAPAPVAQAINRIRLPYNASRPAQTAAIAALSDEAFVEHSIKHCEKGRELLAHQLREYGLHPIPSATNFVTAHFPDTSPLPAPTVEYQLAQRGLLVRGLAGYGLPKCLRISVGTKAEMAALKAALAETLAPVRAALQTSVHTPV